MFGKPDSVLVGCQEVPIRRALGIAEGCCIVVEMCGAGQPEQLQFSTYDFKEKRVHSNWGASGFADDLRKRVRAGQQLFLLCPYQFDLPAQVQRALLQPWATLCPGKEMSDV